MSKDFQKKKNILDIEERNNRSYFTTLVILAFTFLSVLIGLASLKDVYDVYKSLIWMGIGVTTIVIVVAFTEFKKKADKKLEEIRSLK